MTLSPGVTPVKSPTRKRVTWSEALPKKGRGEDEVVILIRC